MIRGAAALSNAARFQLGNEGRSVSVLHVILRFQGLELFIPGQMGLSPVSIRKEGM